MVTASTTTPTITCAAEAARVAGQLVLLLPADASAELPSRGQVAVTGSADGAPFAAVVEPDGRRGHWLKVEDSLADAINPGPGDTVTLSMSVAPEWPEPDVPSDLRTALDSAPAEVQSLWRDITPMARWEWVRWIQATRSDATRDKRVGVGISKMQSGKRRPCCFDLSACTDAELSRSGKLMAPDD